MTRSKYKTVIPFSASVSSIRIYKTDAVFDPLTALQEVHGPVLDLLGELIGALQVPQDVDVGGEQHHILFPAAVRHGQELVQVFHGPAHQVTCHKKDHYMTLRVMFCTIKCMAIIRDK